MNVGRMNLPWMLVPIGWSRQRWSRFDPRHHRLWHCCARTRSSSGRYLWLSHGSSCRNTKMFVKHQIIKTLALVTKYKHHDQTLALTFGSDPDQMRWYQMRSDPHNWNWMNRAGRQAGTTHMHANWMALPPAPVKASMTVPPWLWPWPALAQRAAWFLAMTSGVTEKRPCPSSMMPWSKRENNVYLPSQ